MRYVLVLSLLIVAKIASAEARGEAGTCGDKYSAKLVSLQGGLLISAAGAGRWQAAALNQTICQGSMLKVEPYSRASLVLPSGIVLRMDEGTEVTLQGIEIEKPTLLNLLKGFIHFISRTPRQLEINTPIANAGPEGTEFAIKVDDNNASLWVYEGKVKFFNTKGAIKLNPGEAAQAQAGQAPQAKIDIKPQDAVNWALYYPPILPYPAPGLVIDSGIRTAIDRFRQGHGPEALGQMDKLSIGQQSPYFLKVRAAMRLTLGRVELAQQDIQSLLAANPKDADALTIKSVMALTQNRKDEAYQLAQQAVAANPQSATAYSALSYAEQGRFNLDKAQTAADKAARLAPHDAMVWARKAELELSQGLTADSQQAAKRAIELDTKLERTQTIQGFAHLINMDADDALISFNKATELDSTAPLARLGLGLAKIRNGDLEDGRRDLEIAAILDPNNSIVRSYLGKAYYEERRPNMADEQFKLAKERDPKDPTPYFYDAINKQTTNRPVEALHDMQKAIELNDNRGVYRSKFQLDRDEAARQVGLGRIFTNLGFDDPANRQAMKSLAIDPNNYSAHRLLSDSYANKPRHEIARASEHLQSQLLQPLNYNPIQPSLAYTDLNIIRGVGVNDTAFNEYNRMYERNGVRFTATGIAGSNSTYGDEAALSGILDKFSFSLGQLHYQTNGFRKNNDLKHNIYNVFAQYEILPNFNVQAEYRHRETEHGDLELKGKIDNFDEFKHRKLDQDSYRLGLNISPAKNSNLLFSLIYSDRQELLIDNNDTLRFDGYNRGYDLETQYLFDTEDFNIVLGGGAYLRDKQRVTNSIGNSFCPPIPNLCGVFNSKPTQYLGYLYTNFKILNRLNLTTGLSYDFYRFFEGSNGIELSELNPKLGITWQVNNFLTLRAAGFKVVKPPIVVNQILQPIQLAGFNQFFDDVNGTRSWQYGIGADVQFIKDLFIGIEAFKRDLSVPVASSLLKRREDLYRLYLNWTINNNWIINSGFRFENFTSGEIAIPRFAETSYLPLSISFFSDLGIFSEIKGSWIHQNINTTGDSEQNFNNSFFLVDTAIGYRFPKAYGLISFEIKNLLDKNFKYRDRQFLMNEQRAPDIIPERTFFARVTLNF